MSIDNYIVILGAMKCGTTSLYNYLIERDVICPCVMKEPNYFSDQIRIDMEKLYEEFGSSIPTWNLSQKSNG